VPTAVTWEAMNPNPDPPNGDDSPKDPLAEMLSRLLGGGSPADLQGLFGGKLPDNLQGMDAQELARAAGLPSDPQSMAMMFQQVQAMFTPTPGGGPVNWAMARENARRAAAAQSDPSAGAAQKREVNEALRLAEMWLDPVTDLEGTGLPGAAWSRAEWVEATMDTWQRLTEPVAVSISAALSQALTEQMPEEMKTMMGSAAPMLQNMGGSLFGVQLGQAVGALAREVVSSTDIGIPLASQRMALLPANVAAFGEGLDVPAQEIRLFLAVREAAHVRLFARVPWLAGHLLGAIESYARGIHIDMSRIEEAAREIDPTNPESLQAALSEGLFLPQRTPQQKSALSRLETTLALVEGWVDELTTAATANLPSAQALREMVRRRRATGGPAEHAFAALVGLELRPRRLRDAAALWSHLGAERGIAGRDAVWQHPDLLPTAEDLDDPQGFGARRRLAESADSEVDAALERLLSGGFDDDDSAGGTAGGNPSDDDSAGGTAGGGDRS
jgi:putative hydrolase